jgi:glycosyltransferase involved in cell wall biosynthesis
LDRRPDRVKMVARREGRTQEDGAEGEDTGIASAARNGSARAKATPFMAAVASEAIKLVVTFDPAGPIDEFTRSVGWCSQDELPGHDRAAGICLVPTITQDALSIISAEAMAARRAVIASRIGGLPYTVSEERIGWIRPRIRAGWTGNEGLKDKRIGDFSH